VAAAGRCPTCTAVELLLRSRGGLKPGLSRPDESDWRFTAPSPLERKFCTAAIEAAAASEDGLAGCGIWPLPLHTAQIAMD
jgi:hypothetical protein